MSEPYCPNHLVTVVDQFRNKYFGINSDTSLFSFFFFEFTSCAFIETRKSSLKFVNCCSISIIHCIFVYLNPSAGVPQWSASLSLYVVTEISFSIKSVWTAPIIVDSHLVVSTVVSKKTIEKHFVILIYFFSFKWWTLISRTF